ncbi:unnamed protein product [Agarophyton chilense]
MMLGAFKAQVQQWSLHSIHLQPRFVSFGAELFARVGAFTLLQVLLTVYKSRNVSFTKNCYNCIKEKDIKVSWGDISKNSCYRGSVFNVCRAYIGDDEEKVAVKWVRPRHACGKDHGEKLIKESKESAKLVLDFMNHIGTKGWKVKVLIPKKGRGYFFHDVRSRSVIVEPYLKSFEPFYESSDDLKHLRGTTYGTVLQALIHFSIRHSKRESMISNLQGSVDYKKKTIYLSAPVIKKDFNSFSGKGSISAFLRNHDCSRMCRKH